MPPAGTATYDALRDWSSARGDLGKAKALCVATADGGAIALDLRRLTTEAQRRCALAHELGHVRTGCLYTGNGPKSDVSRAEYRADVWAARVLIPPDKLARAARRGLTEPWQIADHFNVTESAARFAMELYRDQLAPALRDRDE